MTAKAEQNPNAGIEQLFTGLTPDTDARAFQAPPPQKTPRSSWKIVSSDGSRSEASPSEDSAFHQESPTETLSANEEAFFTQALLPEYSCLKPSHIDLPKVNASVSDLAVACEARMPTRPRPELPLAAAPADAAQSPEHAGNSPTTGSNQTTLEKGSCCPGEQYSMDSAPDASLEAREPNRGVWERAQTPRSRENYELARVVQAWSHLPPTIRHAILAIIDSL